MQGAGDKYLEGGCTATVAVMQGSTVVLANVGDSQAVLGTRLAPGQSSGVVVTTRHWGRDPREAERMGAYGESVRLLADGYLQVRRVGAWRHGTWVSRGLSQGG